MAEVFVFIGAYEQVDDATSDYTAVKDLYSRGVTRDRGAGGHRQDVAGR